MSFINMQTFIAFVLGVILATYVKALVASVKSRTVG